MGYKNKKLVPTRSDENEAVHIVRINTSITLYIYMCVCVRCHNSKYLKK